MINKLRISGFSNTSKYYNTNRVRYILLIILILFFITTLMNYNQVIKNGSTGDSDRKDNYYIQLRNSKFLDQSSLKKGFDIHNEIDTQSLFSTVTQIQYLKRYQNEIDSRVERNYKDFISGNKIRATDKSLKERREKFQNKPAQEDFINGMYRTFEIKPNYIQSRLSKGLDDEYNVKRSQYNITIVTQATVDRLDKVKLMAEKWLGPLSVSVYIKSGDKDDDLQILKEYVDNCLVLQDFADFHIFYSNNTWYPVNNLRNLAIKYALTDYVFVMDADFLPPLGLHDYISNHISNTLINPPEIYENENFNYYQKEIEEQQQSNIDNLIPYNQKSGGGYEYQQQQLEINQKKGKKYAFVIPSFSSSIHPRYHPDDKLKLTELVYYQLVSPSNLDICWKCHSPTDFSHWFTTNEPYAIRYNWLYEPYLVYNRKEAVEFDERLKGYGFDKNAHAFSLAVSGYNFIVLPHAFIIHVNHPSASWQGPTHYEQQWNALRVVCEIIKEMKTKHNYSLDEQLFNEPLPNDCFSDLHW